MSRTSTVTRPVTGSPVGRAEGRRPEGGRPAAARHGSRATRSAGCAAVRSARPAVVRPAAVHTAPAPRPATRLTARGRALVVGVLVLLLLAAFSLGRTGAEGSTTVQPAAQLEQVTVLPGETLWALAQRLAPGQDPRPVVDQIRELNELASAELQAGQQLLLPVAQ